ncbi:hypothetical protein K3495_g8537 [Podosphaera aphanis]|nr:hypothetical protein K3495_g8537 [Podosphaera aphanis]
MLSTTLLALTTQALVVLAVPHSTSPILPSAVEQKSTAPYDWSAGYVSDFTIHSSCDKLRSLVLQQGLEDAVKLAQHAREHILVQGLKSPIYQKYFGGAPTGQVTGWYDKIASANRDGIVFRCDDPDKKCETNKQWAGHWRGNNASSETVICEPSFLTRLPLQALCGNGFDVATSKLSQFWGADLIHRLFHVIGENFIEHYSHGYKEAVLFAQQGKINQVSRNTDSLIYFAVEAYTFDITAPGKGCTSSAP